MLARVSGHVTKATCPCATVIHKWRVAEGREEARESARQECRPITTSPKVSYSEDRPVLTNESCTNTPACPQMRRPRRKSTEKINVSEFV